MSIERVSFEAKLLAPPAHETQLVRRDPEDAYEPSVRKAIRREPPEGRPPNWAFDDWPFPFAAFWTWLLGLALAYPAHHLFVSMALAGAGLWAGVKLDRWLRAHPRAWGHRVRQLLGVE